MVTTKVKQAKARKSDPATSHEAASTVKNISETQAVIIRLLRITDMTDDELFLRYYQGAENGLWKHASQPGVRSRRSELVKAGLVRGKGFGKTKFNRAATIWGIS